MALALAAAGWGFAAQGPRWSNSAQVPVPYMVAPAGSDDVAEAVLLVERAFGRWQDVSCAYLTFERQPWSGAEEVANDGVNRVFWVEDEQAWRDFLGQADTLALTFTFSSVDEPEILDADMILNGADWRWTSDAGDVDRSPPGPIDVETVVLHEVGHFFGLAHSDDPSAAMFRSNNKDTQREPAADDIQGVCALYPNGEPVPGADPGDGPVGAPCTTGQDCASELCVDDITLGRTYCSQGCLPAQTNSCPVGFSCEPAGDGNSFCLAPLPVDELCDQCSNGGQCSSGLCISVAGVNELQPFCSQACDPGQAVGCPEDFRCELIQQAGTSLGACVPNTGICDPRGKGGQDELCYANGRCKAGHRCIPYSGSVDRSFCYAECDWDQRGGSCGRPRTVCSPVQGLMTTAACFTFAEVGQPCIPEVCEPDAAFCAFDEQLGIESALCYQRCPNGQSDCPANSECQTFPGLPSICVSNAGFKKDGEACASDEECELGQCRPFFGARLCTRDCDPTDPAACPTGLRCYVNDGQAVGLCGPPAISDPPDPPRGVSGVDDAYCACDRTNQCDDACDCDPECDGGSCRCTRVEARWPGWWALCGLTFGLGIVLAARSRVLRSGVRRSRVSPRPSVYGE